MAKRKMVILPYSVYDVSAMECWLEEMAGKGLHLDVLAGQYGWFEKGEAAEIRYRMEPWAGDVIHKHVTLTLTLQHVSEEIPAVDPEPGKDGLTAGVICAVCKEILVEQEAVPAQ